MKYDSSGVAQWAKNPASSSLTDLARGVAVDINGNVYVSGESDYSLNFGDGVTLTNHASIMNYTFFVVKYDSNGVAQWVRSTVSANGTGSDFAYGVAVDVNSNVYVAGKSLSPSLDLGGVSNDVNLTNRGSNDFFVVKYDSSGVAQWAKNPASGSGTSTDIANSVAVDSSGNVYVAGEFYNTISFGGDVNLINQGTTSYYDFYVVKYEYS